mmetsp:Transcript_55165/g.134050  ORF Transcript_55165/g.134050 Transcript_55165/m.134050 type:complete len:114 (-) Transcript_55165:131-472(-)
MIPENQIGVGDDDCSGDGAGASSVRSHVVGDGTGIVEHIVAACPRGSYPSDAGGNNASRTSDEGRRAGIRILGSAAWQMVEASQPSVDVASSADRQGIDSVQHVCQGAMPHEN